MKKHLIFATKYYKTVLNGENMIITNNVAKFNLTNYSNKNNKIIRDIKDSKLIKNSKIRVF